MPDLDHVALVVGHLEPVLERCVSCGLDAGPIEEFPREGTREVYLGAPERPARLLLMEPTDSTGPYGRALAKRGPGLHHLALHLPEVESFLAGVEGWLLHPCTLETWSSSRTGWLARPGVGTLLEVHESAPTYSGERVVERIQVQLTANLESRIQLEVDGEPVAGLAWTTNGSSRLRLGSRWLEVAELVARVSGR